ncbi:MAG: hypothetical protein IJD88_00015, partial [Clostridia bacterium]|nr:hypothetical protein [Clostridia bacterium]
LNAVFIKSFLDFNGFLRSVGRNILAVHTANLNIIYVPFLYTAKLLTEFGANFVGKSAYNS